MYRRRGLQKTSISQGMAEIHKNSQGSLKGVVKEDENSQQGCLGGEEVQDVQAKARNHGVGSTRESPGMGPDSSNST